MTDRRPTDPDLDAKLRTTLTAAAPVDTHVAEGLADLRSRLDGTTVVALRSASPDRRRGRIALVAAAVVLLAGVIGVAVVTRGDDGGRDVEVTTPPDGSATGWYVPEDLPAGWTLESVRGDFRDAGNREGIEGDCPCPWTTWTSDDGIAVLTLGSAANGSPTATPPAGSGATSVDLTPSIPALVGPDGGDQRTVTWAQDGRRHRLVGLRLTSDEVVRQARSLAEGPASGRIDPAPPPGFRELTRSTVPGGLRGYHAVTVTLHHEERDVRATYTLFPEGLGENLTLFSAPEAVTVEGFTGSELLRFGGIERAPAASPSVFTGRLPGADLIVGDDPYGSVGERVASDADLEALLASLRPVDGDGWRAFVATAAEPVDEDTTVAPTIGDLTKASETVPD